ncbi:LysE family translocator [Arenibaculum pallidiluteum]|uniref:LysE family translocator n=1 Tax=Arenibaculum pallidiluteum TaxID=2812559 RepID=UPI001A97552C|nr:LysE family translocator [Arenibaculum pallidiluteum]
MPDPATLMLFLGASLALNLTPGPDMLFCIANGVGRGRTAGAVAALGIGAGCLVHVAAAAVGLAGLLAASPALFDAVRYAGAAYLAWIAWKTFRAPPTALHGGVAAPGGLRRVFVQGLVTNLLNPKVALFFLAFLPQFVDPAAGPAALQVLVLGIVVDISGTLVNLAVGLGAGGIGGWLHRHPTIARVQQWATGAIFLGLAARLAFAGGRNA